MQSDEKQPERQDRMEMVGFTRLYKGVPENNGSHVIFFSVLPKKEIAIRLFPTFIMVNRCISSDIKERGLILWEVGWSSAKVGKLLHSLHQLVNSEANALLSKETETKEQLSSANGPETFPEQGKFSPGIVGSARYGGTGR
ncbi:hypothetical protein K438DRAFT_1772072 [Mycena galopus ATCC 62051]|nr:hypothetical protein K438DRAFT_1772072 [Mycena galopus ATCC 62051]